MQAAFTCGGCGAEFAMDADDTAYVYPLVHRFFDAHGQCGFATPLHNSSELAKVVPVGRVLRERRNPDPVEADDE